MSEQIRYQNHPPMFRNHPIWFIFSLALIAAFGLGLLILVAWYVKSKSEKLTITETELKYEKGILSKSRSELRLTNIRSTRVNQSFFQRILGTGDILIFTAGDSPEVTAKGLPNPHKVRELVN